MKAIILAGGSGARLWPLSRNFFPKQFLKIYNQERSIFQMSVQRCLRITGIDEIYIVTNNNHKYLILGQIEELGYKFNENNILMEPSGKNTLPAIYYGVKKIQSNGEDITTVFPSDHLIADEDKFVQSIIKARQLAGEYIITFGIQPGRPHTGYGYIKPGRPVETGYMVEEFKEKPDLISAENYLSRGYLWNSGMLMFRTGLFMEEVQRHCPDVDKAFKLTDIEETYRTTPAISVDCGLLEVSRRVAVFPLDIKWNDLGSFDSFYDQFPGDDQGNISLQDNILIDSANNLLYTDKDKTAALIGVNDLIVVDQKDALLLCRKEQSEKVKEVVNKLKQIKDRRVDYHLCAYRPWGSYTILEEGLFYKIKRITVLPEKKLSYQLHHHRSEHWIAVRGTARVTIEGKEYLVRSGESTFVPSGFKHRLENPGKVILEVIEVQLGEYLEEDDIVRFDDDFGRCT